MNDRQRIVVSIGAALVLLSGLLLPYEGLATSKGQDLGSRYLGYHFLFSPPTPQYVYRTITGHEWSRGNDASLAAFHARIVVSQVLISVAALMIATLGAVMVLGGKRRYPASTAVVHAPEHPPQAPGTLPGARSESAKNLADINAPDARPTLSEILPRKPHVRYLNNQMNAIGAVSCLGIAAVVAAITTMVSWSLPASAMGLSKIAFLTSAQLAWHLVTAIFFLRWFHRAYVNLIALGTPARRHKPGWAIGAFFVPFVNFVLPFLIARELSQESHAARLRRAPASNPAAQGIVPLWWLSFLLAVLLDRLGGGYLQRAADPESFRTGAYILLAGNIATAFSAVLAIIVVLEVEHSQSMAK